MPGVAGAESELLAAGILGATVMPHTIYLHSALIQQETEETSDEEKRSIFRFEAVSVVIAMCVAGFVNACLLVVALFNANGLTDLTDLDQAFERLGNLVSGGVAHVFGMALLTSGLSSSSVGTMAGQTVMQGFIDRRIPLFLRRAITLAPALVILGIGLDPSRALAISQVVLSFGVSFAIVPLLIFCCNRGVMGVLVNRPTTVAVALTAVLIISLSAVVLTRASWAGAC